MECLIYTSVLLWHICVDTVNSKINATHEIDKELHDKGRNYSSSFESRGPKQSLVSYLRSPLLFPPLSSLLYH
jgi:hypothetical protein